MMGLLLVEVCSTTLLEAHKILTGPRIVLQLLSMRIFFHAVKAKSEFCITVLIDDHCKTI